MEIAALVCNKKLDYDSTFQAYSIYEYLKNQGNQVQIIDYNLLEDKNNKKNQMLYDFLTNNTILTVNRYISLDQVEENLPLADKYIVVNGNYNDVNINMGENNVAYGINDISSSEIDKLDKNYSKISTSFDINNKKAERVVDPIFLLSNEEWYDIVSEKSSINIDSNYVLLYCDIATKDMIKYATSVAQKNNYNLYIVADKTKSIFFKGKRLKNVNPFELANLIANAQDVITSYNDGIKFAVLFERSLHIFSTQEDEQIELINELNIENRIVNNPEQILSNKRNYEKSINTIEKLKEKSYKFLEMENN